MATIETPKLTAIRGMLPWVSDAAWTQFKEYAPTLLTELAVMISQILAYKLAAHFLGRQGFSEYSLSRRTVTLIIPLVVIGLTVGLPRYLGFSNSRNDHQRANQYYGATLLLVGGTSLLCVLLINSFANTFAYLFFGDPSYGFLAFPLSVMILGLSLHTIVCSYYRGIMQLNRANLIQIVNLGIVPIAAFFLLGGSVRGVLLTLGLAWGAVACLGLVLTPFASISGTNLQVTKEILRYGIQRVPGDFIFMALFALPSTFTAHLSGVQSAGFVAFGMTVLSTIAAVFSPLGLVLLPKATGMLAGGSRRELRKHMGFILRGTIAASVLISLAVWAWIPNLIQLYLGQDFDQIVRIVRILIFGAIPLSVYLVLRTLVDAYHEYAVTGAILLGSFATFLIGCYLGKRLHLGTNAILISLVSALLLQAALSSFECRRILRDR